MLDESGRISVWWSSRKYQFETDNNEEDDSEDVFPIHSIIEALSVVVGFCELSDIEVLYLLHF
jgi:hypothetical protein